MKKSIKKLFAFFVILFAFSNLFGNDNSLASIKTLNKIKFEDIALRIALDQSIVKEGTTSQAAQNKLLAMFPKLRYINQKLYLKYQDVALICMQVYNLQGGFFYTLTENRHYSFRELQFLNIISQDIDPMKRISGKDAYILFTKSAELQVAK